MEMLGQPSLDRLREPDCGNSCDYASCLMEAYPRKCVFNVRTERMWRLFRSDAEEIEKASSAREDCDYGVLLSLGP